MYLSKVIENEIISIIANEIISAHEKNVLKNKYYSTILECTPDISHTEQLSVVLRTVYIYFLEQLPLKNTSFDFVKLEKL